MNLLTLDPTQDPEQDLILPSRPHPVHKTPPAFRNFVDVDGICWLTFDTPNSTANVWNMDTLDELDSHIEDIHRDGLIRALVIRSNKERVFIAGADLKNLLTLPPDELNELIAMGQDVFTHLESLRIPKIAAIHGACVGGGFELALACDWRIASDHESTRIGLPETQLGLIPAWGGSTRLSRLIGLPAALDLIVRGKLLKADHAKRLGLVDEVVPVENLQALAKKLALGDTQAKHPHFHFSQLWPIPRVLRMKARGALLAKYPWMKHETSAPLMAVEVVTQGASKSFEESLALEQKTMRELMASSMTRSLITTFFAKEAASKKLPAALVNVPTRSLTNVTVIGAGVMGAGIAYALACKGSRVLVCDTTADFVARGAGRINQLFSDGLRHHALTKLQARDAQDRIGYTFATPPLHHMDLVVEAVVEDLRVKKALLADLAKRCGDQTILATNTSALSVAQMAEGIPHPERVIGLHFFNPAHVMPLVEVVALDQTSPEVVATAMRFVQSLGKTPILVKDSPGFVVNRILMPYMLGAVQLAERMRDPWIIDEAMMEFGMPMGPLRLLDEVGFEVALHVEKTLRAAFGDRIPKTDLLQNMKDAGMLGCKNGLGFYLDDEEPNPDVLPLLKTKEVPGMRSKLEISSHLQKLLQAEAARCLEDGVVASAEDIKLAMLLGTGFPPFRDLFPLSDTGILPVSSPGFQPGPL